MSAATIQPTSHSTNAGLSSPHPSETHQRAGAGNPFNADELADLADSVKNLIEDKQAFCPNEEGTPEAVERLTALLNKLHALMA
ncbi:TPA: hypothetical protein VDU83_006749 [Pseudomonas aeruginosa]|nr:hypothetical protein [Pseudomonas aeruginosa]